MIKTLKYIEKFVQQNKQFYFYFYQLLNTARRSTHDSANFNLNFFSIYGKKSYIKVQISISKLVCISRCRISYSLKKKNNCRPRQ